MRCGSCGQEMPMLKPGTMVESYKFDKYVKGVIVTTAVEDTMKRGGRQWALDTVHFINIETGEFCSRGRAEVKVIHGYVHITR